MSWSYSVSVLPSLGGILAREVLPDRNKQYVEIKRPLDASDWLFFAQHVSGTIMPIIRSSRVIQMVASCGTWRCKDGKCNL